MLIATPSPSRPPSSVASGDARRFVPALRTSLCFVPETGGAITATGGSSSGGAPRPHQRETMITERESQERKRDLC